MDLRVPKAVRATFALVALWLGAYLITAILGVQGSVPILFGRYAHIVVLAAIASTCVVRAVRVPAERLAWGLIAAAMLCWTLGELYFTAHYWTATSVPTPTLADAGYLAVYPLAFVGLMVLLRFRARDARLTLWIDGVVAALVVAAYGATVVFDAVLSALGGDPLSDAVNLAYPLGDLLLLGIVVTAFAMARWRVNRSGLLITLGVLCFWVADSLYLVSSVQKSYSQGGALDVIGWGGFMLVALAAWQPAGTIRQRSSQETTRTVLAPVLFGVLGLALLFAGTVTHVNALATALASLALLGVLARLMMTFHEKNTLLDGTRRQALTDSLTGLGNSRGMRLELDARFEEPRRPFALALFDLDGFKPYNDRFGHPAGDSLLERAGRRLALTVDGRGAAFRAGGDEFCVMLDCDHGSIATMIERCRHALSERGEGFDVVASAGVVHVPEEASDASSAMRLADLRLYDEKHLRSGDPRHQAARALVQMMREQNAERSTHLSRVARLSRAVCRQLGLPAEQVDEVVRAAELHDIGMIAIPDTLLEKRGPLTEQERAFVERHPVIGERVLGAAPSLAPIARIVRATHERWDGTGYPDGIAGEAIPVGSRIILACNAYDAITSERPYRERRWPAEALAELWVASGTQLDPAVVAALQAAVRAGADIAPEYVVRVAEPIL